ncbi:MAG: hypothetical protein PHS51_13420 [Gallionella sp.]|nr:hypothetical protein [Gallionella sp.]
MLIYLSFTEYRVGIHPLDGELGLGLYVAKAFSTNLAYQWQQFSIQISPKV